MYSSNFDDKTMARAQALSLPMSLKQSVEVCKFINNRKYPQAVRILEDVKLMKIPIPYTRFNRGGTGHRKGMASGRYPKKVCGYMLKLLKSVYANANQKGLDTNNLIIKAVVAKQGPKSMRYGRHRGRKAKRTHVEIIVMENKKKTTADKKVQKTTKPVPDKIEQKTAVKNEPNNKVADKK